MPIALPPPLATFFAAERHQDFDGLAGCFTDHAVVRDEGRTIEGPYQIKQWMKDAKAKYQHVAEPIEIKSRDGKTVVVARVAGNFPNSPLNLEHVFTMEGERIAALEIR